MNHNQHRETSVAVRDSSEPQQAFEPLLDSEEAAALLKIHPKTLQKMARNGEISGMQVGKLWRFRASTLNQWLEEAAGRGKRWSGETISKTVEI